MPDSNQYSDYKLVREIKQNNSNKGSKINIACHTKRENFPDFDKKRLNQGIKCIGELIVGNINPGKHTMYND